MCIRDEQTKSERRGVMLSVQESEERKTVSHEIGKQKIQMTGVSFAVIDKYKNMIYRTAVTMTSNHADAEDVLQEVFFRYFRLQPSFESESHEKAWFLRVTINECKNLLRSVWKRRRTDFDLESLVQTDTYADERDSVVLRAVMSLSEKYRISIYLYYYEEYSIREIASITSQTEAAVSQQLTRGRRKLRKKLGGDES